MRRDLGGVDEDVLERVGHLVPHVGRDGSGVHGVGEDALVAVLGYSDLCEAQDRELVRLG